MFAQSRCFHHNKIPHTVQWYLIEHVGRQADHGKVVNYQDRSEVDWLPPRHQLWPRPYNDQVAQEDTADWNRRIDQQPVVCPLVWKDKKGEISRNQATIVLMSETIT